MAMVMVLWISIFWIGEDIRDVGILFRVRFRIAPERRRIYGVQDSTYIEKATEGKTSSALSTALIANRTRAKVHPSGKNIGVPTPSVRPELVEG